MEALLRPFPTFFFLFHTDDDDSIPCTSRRYTYFSVRSVGVCLAYVLFSILLALLCVWCIVRAYDVRWEFQCIHGRFLMALAAVAVVVVAVLGVLIAFW